MSCLSCCRGYRGVDEIINVLMVKGNAEISHVEELMSEIITTRKMYDCVIIK